MKSITVLLVLLLTVGAVSQPGEAADEKVRDPYRAGLTALRAGANQSAITFLTRAIQRDPHNHRYYNDRGVAYKRAGNLEAALLDYARALEIEPDYENALNNRGIVYLAQGFFDKAIADFTKAMKSEKLKAKASNNLGIAYAAKGNHRDAIRYFNQAISFGSTDHRTFLFLGESLRRIGSAEKALRVYHLALGLSKDPKIRKQIESSIASLKQDLTSAQSAGTRSSQGKGSAGETISVSRNASQKEAPGRTSMARTILRASPLSERTKQSGISDGNQQKGEIGSIEDLDNGVRGVAIKKLSPVSAQIYAQGREFLEKADTAKALVRFEDTRQLERRKRSHYGVAWSDIEIGRAYSALGEHHKATPYFEESLRFFKRLGAQDESILAMTELAKNQIATRGKSESAAHFKKAVEMAVSAGYYKLAKAIGDQSAGSDNKADKRSEKQRINSLQKTVSHSSAFGRKREKGKQVSALVGSSTQPEENSEKAVARGDERTTQRQEPGKTLAKKPIEQPAVSGVKKAVDKASTTLRTEASDSRRSNLTTVGGGTNWYVKWGDRAGKTSKPLVTPDRPISTPERIKKTEIEPQPKRVVFYAEGTKPPADRHSSKKRTLAGKPSEQTPLQKDLAELRQLKAQNDERKMLIVLERLSQHYVKLKEYAKALHCLDASMGFRDDLRFTKGQSEALEQRGLVKEKLGLNAGGLEDFTRALALGEERPRPQMDLLRVRAKKLASQMGLDTDAVLRTFDSLWTARKEEDGIGETRALFQLGKIYEKSGRNQDALMYYRRASASILADSALLHAKMGQTDRAGELYHQAMEALKDIDYSRFIDLKHKSRVPNTISRQ